MNRGKKPKKIKNLEDVTDILSKFNIYGIGLTAHPRLVPGLITKNFTLICAKTSRENEVNNRRGINTFCIDNDTYASFGRKNSVNILLCEPTKNLLNKSKKPYLFIYRNNKTLTEHANEHGWNIIGNEPLLIDQLENKAFFREMISTLGIPRIPGEVFGLSDFLNLTYSEVKKKYNTPFVVQFPDRLGGGGKTTVFIRSQRQYRSLHRALEESSGDKTIQRIQVTKYIIGKSISVLGCVTPQGVLHSSVNLQLIDIPEVTHLKRGGGLFCGHTWPVEHMSEESRQSSYRLVRTIGEHIATRGYKGIFGIDMLLENDTGNVYPLECNPRLTGALPVASLFLLQKQMIPLEAFHILSFLPMKYTYSPEHIQKDVLTPFEGSHLVLTNLRDYPVQVTNNISTGVYTLHGRKLVFLRDGIVLADIRSNDEFLLADAIPEQGKVISAYMGGELVRMGKIIFPVSISTDGYHISPYAKKVVSAVYKALGLKKWRKKG